MSSNSKGARGTRARGTAARGAGVKGTGAGARGAGAVPLGSAQAAIAPAPREPGPPPRSPPGAQAGTQPDAPPPGPIVPAGNVAGRALVFVIAIMTFLACLTEGSASLARGAANAWAGDVQSGATIQIAPTDVADLGRALETARAFALSVAGVTRAVIVDEARTAAMLEPWLGAGLSLDDLPVPRIIEVTVDRDDPPNLAAMRDGLATAVPGAVLDDHGAWLDRLLAAARWAVLIGGGLMVLVVTATMLTVVFATRGAMVGNRHIIEVLHFVGADAAFVAGQFERHFLRVGAKGAAAGLAVAVALFGVLALWPGTGPVSRLPALGLGGFAGMALIAGLIAVVTSLTTGLTVRRALDEMDRARGAGESQG